MLTKALSGELPSTTTSPSGKLLPLSLGADPESLAKFLDRRLLGAPTGIPELDNVLLGLGGLTILQGAPGSNKSTFALQVAYYNARQGRPCLVLDEENGRGRTKVRLLSQFSRRSETSLQKLRLTAPTEFAALLAEYVKLPVYISSGQIDGPDDVDALAAELMKGVTDYGFLVVDSIQALPPIVADPAENLVAWSKRLDRLKLTYDGRLVILATSEKTKTTFDLSSLSGAKGSAAIPYKGEMILDFVASRAGEVRVEVVKNRDGVRGCSWVLELLLEDPKNLNSFVFLLAPRGGLID